MKQLLLGLMLLVPATAASAEWTRVEYNDNYILYVDRATIRRNGNLVKMWSLVDYKTVKTVVGQSNLSYKAQEEYDCKEEKSRTLAITWFTGQMGRGTVNHTDNRTGEWSPIAPESNGEVMWKITCGKK